MSVYGLAILVESLGDPSQTATDGEYRYAWCTERASDMDVDLSFPTLKRIPNEISVQTDFVKSEATVGGMTFELDGSASQVGPRFFVQRPEKISNLWIAVDSTSTIVWLVDDDGVTGDTTQAGKTIMLGREAIYLDTHGGGGQYTSCVRGALSTIATGHEVDATSDVEIYDADSGPLLQDRQIEFVRYKLDDWLGRTTLWRGVLNDTSSTSVGNIALHADSVLSLLQQREICTHLFRGPAGRVVTRNTTENVSGAIQDIDAPSPPVASQGATPGQGDDFLISIEGKASIVGSWWSNFGDFFNVQASEDDLLIDSAPLPDSITGEMWEYFSTTDTAPAINTAGDRLGQMVGGTAQSAITCILQVLTTTVQGGNGFYDLGGDREIVGRTLGVGIPADSIDIAGIESVRDQLGPDDIQRSLNLGMDGKPVNVYAWISSILQPYGAVLTSGSEGKITIIRMLDWPTASTPSVTASDFIGEIKQRRNMRESVDTLDVEYHDRPGYGTKKLTYRDALHYERKFASSRNTRAFLAPGVSQRGAIARMASAYLERFRHPIPGLQCSLLRDKNYWPGQILKITHPFLYDTDGTRGVTDAIYMVTSRRDVLAHTTVWYEMLRLDLGRIGLISPAALVASYDNSDPFVITVDTDIDYGHEQFIVDDDVQILDTTMDVQDPGPYTVTAVTPTTITVDADIGAGAGDWIVLCEYDTAAASTAGQQSWAWVADSAGTLGAANDDAFIWVTI